MKPEVVFLLKGCNASGSETHSIDIQDLHQQGPAPLILFGISRKVQPLKKNFFNRGYCTKNIGK